jgi:hypothetical protein
MRQVSIMRKSSILKSSILKDAQLMMMNLFSEKINRKPDRRRFGM